ncbi:MAG: gamma-glutamyl-gamma-aminobutyrate hydrolase family protein [Clostridia bacterium]|nr:gamma-glutamyl-gamma-aminobutyrate hydrolase family protein [Clostridia bacterium]
MKIAIIERLENYKEDEPFNKRYIIDESYKEIFDQLNALVIPVISENNLEEIANICDALILPGSAVGVDPKYYKDVPFPGKEYNYDEYKLDKKVIDLFVKRNKPILGICGGLQTLNVYFGGDLNQNILNHKLIDGSMHKVKIAPNSFLSEVYNQEEIEVNSYHRQAIRKLAPNFDIIAVSEDGIIEAIGDKNIIGVQWHPEILRDMKFFTKFVNKFLG